MSTHTDTEADFIATDPNGESVEEPEWDEYYFDPDDPYGTEKY